MSPRRRQARTQAATQAQVQGSFDHDIRKAIALSDQILKGASAAPQPENADPVWSAFREVLETTFPPYRGHFGLLQLSRVPPPGEWSANLAHKRYLFPAAAAANKSLRKAVLDTMADVESRLANSLLPRFDYNKDSLQKELLSKSTRHFTGINVRFQHAKRGAVDLMGRAIRSLLRGRVGVERKHPLPPHPPKHGKAASQIVNGNCSGARPKRAGT